MVGEEVLPGGMSRARVLCTNGLGGVQAVCQEQPWLGHEAMIGQWCALELTFGRSKQCCPGKTSVCLCLCAHAHTRSHTCTPASVTPVVLGGCFPEEGHSGWYLGESCGARE